MFQPAEEGLGGARAMIQEGVLENPDPDIALGLHLWNTMPVGQVAISPGPTMAGTYRFNCLIEGLSGHGAMPHLARDPIVTAAQIIVALQTIIARNIDPFDLGVISVCQIHSGRAFNVIPKEAEIMGTIRSLSPQIQELIVQRIKGIIDGVSSSMECKASFEIEELNSPLVNNDDVTEVVRKAAVRIVGEDAIISERTSGGDDFSFVLQEIPGCYFFVGSANPTNGLDFPHHHPCFDFDENAMVIGTAILASAVADYLSK